MATASSRKKRNNSKGTSRPAYPAGVIMRALLNKRPVREIISVCSVLLALYLLISLGNHPNTGLDLIPSGWLGYYSASFLLAGLGIAAWGIPWLLLFWAALLVKSEQLWHPRLYGVILLVLDLGMAAGSWISLPVQHLWEQSLAGQGGGLIGNYMAFAVQSIAGRAGLYIGILALLITGLILTASIPLAEWPVQVRQLVQGLRALGERFRTSRHRQAQSDAGLAATLEKVSRSSGGPNPFSDDAIVIKPDPDITGSDSRTGIQDQPAPAAGGRRPVATGSGDWNESAVSDNRPSRDGEDEMEHDPAAPGTPKSASRPAGAVYKKPSLDLLRDISGERAVDRQEIQSKVKILEQTFANFGVEVKVVEVSCGPVVTRYELSPAPGVKVSRISSLADDLQLSMAARGLRLEVPIPGKAAIGIEIPNDKLAAVTLKSILSSSAFQNLNNPLAMALGEDIAGNMMVAELNEMPHLLVAGATGSGKSVCVNAMIMSLLFNSHPDDVKMVLIDPKKVELTGYNGIPHLLAPVVTDPKKAARVLKWMTAEMEKRYQLFTDSGVRDIKRYNEKAAEALPFIVVVIDELADLMMVSPADVEDSICRLAQMARAAGIHLIVSTQRPSVDVITGLIKANIPSRIAFAVSSQVDSRTILDGAGAEKLLGKGDMLYMPIGAIKPLRVQGAYVSDSEILALVEFLKGQVIDVENSEDHTPLEEDIEQYEDEADDVLFWDAVRLVVSEERLSASFLQRKLKVGYSRAARLVDMMEERGIVSAMGSDRKRRILISSEELEQILARKRF